MKTNLKRLLAILLAMTMLLALSVTAFAEDEDGDEHAKGLIVPEVRVFFPPSVDGLQLKVGEKTTVAAIVDDAGDGATYDWKCSNERIVSIKGSKEKVTVTALNAGEAQITLTVTRADGLSSDFDYFVVSVENVIPPVTVRGGGSVKMEAGESENLSVSVSGGSGSYSFVWEAHGDAALAITDKLRNNAEIYAGKAGSGTVILTVYDAEDSNNNATVKWDFTVTAKKQAKAPVVEMNRGSVDLGAGSSGSLRIAVSGGSGNYDFVWRSDNPRVVTVEGHGELGDIYAANTLIASSNTATISAYVRDVETGLTSNTVSCKVTVTGGSTEYDTSARVKAGDYYGMDAFAKEISMIAQADFGSKINLSASIRFSSTSSNAGALRLQNDRAVRAGTSYTFASFQDMYFYAETGGSFKTEYMIVDGGNTINGWITIEVEGGGRYSVKDASLSTYEINMPTYSSEYLTLSVSPTSARYDVVWEVKDPSLITISGQGNRITVKSRGRVGKTVVIATVYDASGPVVICSCNVTVDDEAPEAKFDTSLTVTLGSDYYGTTLSENMASKFKSVFGVYPSDNATFTFTSFGNPVYGALYMSNGAIPAKNRNYTFREWVEMYFVPNAKGTYTANYRLTYKDNTLSGEIKINVEAASLAVTLDKTTLRMAPYSSQYLMLSVSPAAAYYKVDWFTTDSRVAAVSGSNATAVVNTAGPGTAVITAVVTDIYGIEIRRSCTVIVDSNENVYNPSVATTIGIPYVGTGTSSAMRDQFASLYNSTLADSAIIRFSSTGNNDVGVMRLADGSPIQPNVDYTLAQYVTMYTQPISSGTFSVPYKLTYAGLSLSGTVSVVISPATISTNFTLPANAAFSFSDSLNGVTGMAMFSDSITNTVGANWGYICFGKTADGTGALYLDRSLTAIKSGDRIAPAALAQLYFVPGELNGTFTAPYTVYNAAGNVLGNGTLNISRPGSDFSDVPADAYYAPAVKWAVSRGITSGTGGNNFSPDMSVNRGQAVTFLWRAAGQPKPIATVNPFTDVAVGAYYYDAVLWAVQQGITNGTSETTFSPDNPLNRDQLLTFLCRANGGYAGGADWSKLAVDWANSRGLLEGVPGPFVAAAECPRSEVVYYLWKNYNG